MSNYIIIGKNFLQGTVNISGSKNSALPIMAAALLTDDECTIKNIPPLNDVLIMEKILNSASAKTDFDIKNNVLKIKTKNPVTNLASNPYMDKIRASFLAAGPLLAHTGSVSIALPGGCSIGSRPIDLHLKGLSKLGAEFSREFGIVNLKCKKLKGADIYLDFPSVGATENIIMSAVLADGTTTLSNAAMEPEITDLCSFLNKMGAQITGAGTDTVKITGVPYLHGASHTVIPDRIEAGTFMLIGAACGNVTVNNVIPAHLLPVSAKLKELGVDVIENKSSITVHHNPPIINSDIKTLPFPGFPTDMQPQFMSLMTLGKGTGIINETIFENRFLHAAELVRMGADIKTDGRCAVVRGVPRLTGTNVTATDLRAGASLIISALCAEGATTIGGISHISRGYYNLEKKLKNLGANIKKC